MPDLRIGTTQPPATALQRTSPSLPHCRCHSARTVSARSSPHELARGPVRNLRSMAALSMAKPFAGASLGSQFGKKPLPARLSMQNGTAAKLSMKSKSTYNVEVAVGVDEPADSALRRFRRAVTASGVIPEVRRRRYFENTQDMRKRKKKDLRLKSKKFFKTMTWEETQNTPPAPFADMFGTEDDIFGEV